nr:S phase cyclin A-associated protein in the endoplasmic reticulum [Anolis sagrei ordinatus]
MTSQRRDARRRHSAGRRRGYDDFMGSAKNVISESVDVEDGYGMMASFQRSNSHDKVRKIVAEEGRTARNLIAWSVPLENKEDEGKPKWQIGGKSKKATQGIHKTTKQSTTPDCKIAAAGEKNFDKSPTKTRQPRKVDLRARYWAFLFDNLRRAVDEIYVTCESDQSVVECKEVLMMLDNYVRDFKALIDWIQLQEKLEKADAQSRPTSLAWEVKKMSPGRHVIPNLERRDAEGWETVQRGRPVRSKSFPLATKTASSAESSRFKDDSDKENVILCPSENRQKGLLMEDGVSKTTEPNWKDPSHQCEHPLAERTQFTARVLEDVKVSEKNGLGDGSLQAPSEVPVVLIDAEHLPKDPQAEETICVASKNDNGSQGEKKKMESEMDPADISNSMAEVLAKKEELADRLEKANEEAIASAIAEEEQLTREIEAEENNDINIETDNDSDFSASMGSGSFSFCGISMDWNDVLADYEARESWRQNNSWGDIVEEEPSRPPGHGIHMHEKLSSPSRKRTIAESKKKHEEKQMKAQQLREKLREEKTLKLQKLMEREKDVRKWKEELLDQRRRMMEEKLLHAEFKREVQLQAIVKKAQEEEAKVNEIAFINTLEAQNKRHDVLSKLKEYEQRLNELQEERQRRQEEKQARDEAVQERKRALEAERQARVEELLMKRKEQEARIEQQRQEKERAREDAARERARDREERLAALTAAQQEAMEELQKKIQLKHDESIRRHMEQIEQRKEKAAELSSGRHANTDYAPKLTPYERKKQCSLCNVVISSEVYLFSHIKGKKHQQAVRENSSIQGRELSDEEVEHLSLKKYIVDILVESLVPTEPLKDSEERQKTKKKAKKLKARMNSRAKEYESLMEAKNLSCDSPYKAKLQRLVKDLLKQLQGQDSNKASALDRILGEISRILEKENTADQIAFHIAGGFTALEQILQVATASPNLNTVSRIPLKAFGNVPLIYMRRLFKKFICRAPQRRFNPHDRELKSSAYLPPSNLKLFEDFTMKYEIQTCVFKGLKTEERDEGDRLEGSRRNAQDARAPRRCGAGDARHAFAVRGPFGLRLRYNHVRQDLSPAELRTEHILDNGRGGPHPRARPTRGLVYVPDDHNATLGRTANKQVFEGVVTGILRIVATVFGCLISSMPYGNNQTSVSKLIQETKNKASQAEVFNSRIQDLICYMVNIGLVEKLCCCFLSVQGPVDENPKVAAFLQNATMALHGMCELCFAVNGRSWNIFDESRQDPTGLTAALEATDLVGVLHMLYCILFHGTIVDLSAASPKESYVENTVLVALQSLRFFNSFAVLNLQAFQSVVGAEGLSLAFRHITSSLLWHCSQHTCEALLHEVIVCIGYFTVNHLDNQVIVQSGRHPTVLQKLCQLPFQYFSDPRLIKVLFPTLIAACYNNPQNKIILEQEMSCVLLATFIQDFTQSQTDNQPCQPNEKLFGPQYYLELSNRFPRQTWEEARQFFLKKDQK